MSADAILAEEHLEVGKAKIHERSKEHTGGTKRAKNGLGSAMILFTVIPPEQTLV